MKALAKLAIVIATLIFGNLTPTSADAQSTWYRVPGPELHWILPITVEGIEMEFHTVLKLDTGMEQYVTHPCPGTTMTGIFYYAPKQEYATQQRCDGSVVQTDLHISTVINDYVGMFPDDIRRLVARLRLPGGDHILGEADD